MQSPVSGTTTYDYDAAGNLVTTTDGSGALTARTYDAAGRLLTSVSTKAESATETIAWSYDDATSGNFGRGRLTGVSDPTGSTAYRYERRGLAAREQKTIEGNTYTTRYTYDADGNRSSITYPSGRVVTYTSDHAGRNTTTTAGTTALVTTAAYLPFGPLSELQMGNGTLRTVTYDPRYRPERNTLTGPGGTLADYSYGHDDAGNILTLHDALDATFNRTFGYDELNRLTSAHTGASLWGAGSYSYDAMGNMQALQVGLRHASFTYSGATPKLTGVSENGIPRSVTYDAAGNERTIGASTYDYSARNHLRSGDTATYLYDARGVRTVTQVGGTSRKYSLYTPELNLLAETETTTAAAPAIAYEYVWFNGQPLAQFETSSGAINYYFNDHLGAPILQTSSTGAVVWRAEREPYGERYAVRAGADRHQPLGLPGQEYHSGAPDRQYNVFRWYNSSWGRYTQADPIGLIGGINLYAYALGNPLTFIDPGGLSAAAVGKLLFGGACMASDGPLPFGDVLGAALVGAAWSELTKANCKKCGDCTPDQQAFLQSLVDQHCKGASSKCTPNQDLQTLQANLVRNLACALAREDINNTCFKGGDAGHKEAANNARAAAAKCGEYIWKFLVQQPGTP